MPDRPRLTPAMADVRRAVRDGLAAAGVVPGDLLLVGCSGGADSMALALAAAFEGSRAGIRVGAVVVEHGLQEETKVVAANTAARLRALGLEPVEVVPVKVSGTGGTEAAAREARYSALAASALKYAAKGVLLGHTLNDQAETVLLGLARGSGLKSIAGMAPITSSDAGPLWLRPLLGITRQTTEAVCRDAGEDFWVDPHNSDSAFARVRVRSQVLPVLEAELGPGVAEALARTAELVASDLTYLEQQAEAEYGRLAKLAPTGLTLSATDLAGLPQAIRGRVIHRALAVFGDAAAKVHVDQVLELVTNWHGQKELTLPGVRVVRQADDLGFKSTKTLKPGAC